MGGNVLLSSCTVGPDPHEYARPTCGVHNEMDMVTHFAPICTPVVTVSYTLMVLQRSRVTFR